MSDRNDKFYINYIYDQTIFGLFKPKSTDSTEMYVIK